MSVIMFLYAAVLAMALDILATVVIGGEHGRYNQNSNGRYYVDYWLELFPLERKIKVVENFVGYFLVCRHGM